MMRKVFLSVLALTVMSGLALAAGGGGNEMKATGVVKSVMMDSLTLETSGQDWDFVVTEDTSVVAKGGNTLTRAANAEGKDTTIEDFVQKGQMVTVEYHEKDGKRYADKVRFDKVRKAKQ
jgi:hypothetical protein